MILSSSLFVVLIGFSMLLFPGGNYFDNTSVHYNFFLNYLSDLGNSITITGKDNTFSKILFITAFGSFGIILIYFSRIWWAMGTDVLSLKATGYASKISLIICGISFIGIAFSPISSLLEMHLMFIVIAAVSYSLWIILILILQNNNDKLRKLFILNIVNLILMILFIIIIFNYTKPVTEDEFEFYAISQMIYVISIGVNLFIQSVGLMHFLKTSDFRRSGIRNFYV